MESINIQDLPQQIQLLLQKRNDLRNQGQFTESDDIRKEIEKEGFTIVDSKTDTLIYKKEQQNKTAAKHGTLILFGSGEISSVGRSIHEYVLQKQQFKNGNIVIISTPAGFQPNVKSVYGEIQSFFQEKLINFHPTVSLIYANTKDDANNPEIIHPIYTADYIFTGPGSPTYAVKHMQDTLLMQAINSRLQEGATLSLASAATIAFSNYCLPVYEIYKVGVDTLYFEKGLDFFSAIYKPLTIIPHLNNSEGGEKTETSYCFMGKQRFLKLRKLLPQNEEVWGIDEHTAVIINLQTKEVEVKGKGTLHKL